MKKLVKRFIFYFLIALLFIVAYFVYVYNDLTAISKGYPIPEYGVTKTAALVIDIQEGYTGMYAKEDTHSKQAKALIENTNRVISAAYEAGIQVLYIQQQTENWLINWLDGGSMAEGSPAVEIDQRVKIVSLHQFKKRKSDAFSSHDMDVFLNEMQINRLIITGLDMAGCAYNTSQAALNRGYEVFVIEEAVISSSDELKQEKLVELSQAGAIVLSVEDLPDLISMQTIPD
jgi:nicotinamidase-related amidase